MKISRREVLKAAGVAGVAAGLMSCGRKSVSPTVGPEYGKIPGFRKEQWVASTCGLCPASCGIRARVVNGNAVKIEGNPLSPVNRGGVCPKAHAALQVLYDPDRLKGPLKNTGSGNSRQWTPLSWEDAVRMLSRKLKDIRGRGAPHSVMVLCEDAPSLRRHVVERFLTAYGSPNVIHYPSNTSAIDTLAYRLMWGHEGVFVPDWKHAGLVVSFGVPLLEAAPCLGQSLGGYGDFRRGEEGRRGRLVQIEPRYSLTAAKADEWIPIKPGADGALALGIARVLIESGSYDTTFVNEQTFGFEKWKDEKGIEWPGFKDLALREKSLPEISELTGVPVGTIERLAKDLWRKRPSTVIPPPTGGTSYTNSLFSAMAAHALNALVGGVARPVGMPAIRDLPSFPPLKHVEKDPVAEKGLSMPAWGNRAWTSPTGTDKEPYPIELLILLHGDPLRHMTAQERKIFVSWLERIPTIVSFSSSLDETGRFADLLLPVATDLERWDLSPAGLPGKGTSLALTQPVVRSFRDTRESGGVFLDLANELGGTIASSLPWEKWEDAVKGCARTIFETGGISVAEKEFPLFWKKLLEDGGYWTERTYPNGNWKTRSGKFEFFAQELREKLVTEGAGKPIGEVLVRRGIAANPSHAFLPHHEPPQFVGAEKEYPFILVPYRLIMDSYGRAANAPWLLENYGLMLDEQWNPWVEMHPETALRLGVKDGETVQVESVSGKIEVKSHLSEGVLPGVIAMPMGLGCRGGGRWGAKRGADVMEIVSTMIEPISGQSVYGTTRVKIAKS